MYLSISLQYCVRFLHIPLPALHICHLAIAPLKLSNFRFERNSGLPSSLYKHVIQIT